MLGAARYFNFAYKKWEIFFRQFSGKKSGVIYYKNILISDNLAIEPEI